MEHSEVETNLRPNGGSETAMSPVEEIMWMQYHGRPLDQFDPVPTEVENEIRGLFPEAPIAMVVDAGQASHVGVVLEDGHQCIALCLNGKGPGYALIDNRVKMRCIWLDTWHSVNIRGRYYAASSRTKRLLHRHIMMPEDGMVIDHVNSNGLDCRISNMRECLPKENARNQRIRDGKRFKGICKVAGGWKASIKCNGKTHNLGTFPSEEAAAKAYDAAAKALHGEFARLNFPEAA